MTTTSQLRRLETEWRLVCVETTEPAGGIQALSILCFGARQGCLVCIQSLTGNKQSEVDSFSSLNFLLFSNLVDYAVHLHLGNHGCT